VASQYPIIITLEDHLTSKLQKKVVEVCYKFFLSLSFSLGMFLVCFCDQIMFSLILINFLKGMYFELQAESLYHDSHKFLHI
jgi:hypothetical protein